jgi:hypothetical protein
VRAVTAEDRPAEIHYDPAKVIDFTAHVSEVLYANVRLGREFLQEALQHMRIENGGRRTPPCPICGRAIRKVNPQDLQRHGLTLGEAFKSYPALGFTKKALGGSSSRALKAL